MQTDSIHQQQKALRTKTFDQLAAEQRTASAGRDMEQPLVKSKDKEQHWETFEEKITTQGSKYNFNSNCHSLRYEMWFIQFFHINKVNLGGSAYKLLPEKKL